MGRILTIDEASELLSLSPQVVRDYLRRGKLPGGKIGRHWRIVEEDLLQFVRRAPSPTPEETQVRPRVSAYGKHPLPGRSVDDFLREKREETEREEREWEERHKS